MDSNPSQRDIPITKRHQFLSNEPTINRKCHVLQCGGKFKKTF